MPDALCSLSTIRQSTKIGSNSQKNIPAVRKDETATLDAMASGNVEDITSVFECAGASRRTQNILADVTVSHDTFYVMYTWELRTSRDLRGAKFPNPATTKQNASGNLPFLKFSLVSSAGESAIRYEPLMHSLTNTLCYLLANLAQGGAQGQPVIVWF